MSGAGEPGRGAAVSGAGEPSRRVALVGVGLLAVLGALALAAPLLAPYDPAARAGPPFAEPSLAHPLGTNDVGQDLLSLILHGGRVSLMVGTAAAAVAVVVGAGVGLVAGGAGRVVDALAMRLVDMVLALPLVPLTIVIGVFAGPGLLTQVGVIAAVMWAGTARELRSQVLSLRERDDVRAARAMGASPWHLLRRHLAPAVTPLVVPQFVLAAKTAILLEAALSFLGLGDAGRASWGTILSAAYERSAFLTGAWVWWVLPPGLCIAAAVLAFALIGYGLELRGQPHRAGAHAASAAPVVSPAHAALVAGSRPRRPAAQGDAPHRQGPHRGARRPGAARPGSARRGAARRGAAASVGGEPVLAVEGLTVDYRDTSGNVRAVEDVTLRVAGGEAVALVGESGSGKTTLVAAALGLLAPSGRVVGGSRLLCGQDVGATPPARLRRLHGAAVAVVPQEAMSALNPVVRVGDQIVEAIRVHRRVGVRSARKRARELLEQAGVPADRTGAWPHELSGGMRQRAVVAMALANDPMLLVADEPTHGLDALRAAELVELLAGLRARTGLALLVVSHDLPLALRLADRVVILRRGGVVEEGAGRVLARSPRHPYTRRLLSAVPVLPAGAPTSRGGDP